MYRFFFLPCLVTTLMAVGFVLTASRALTAQHEDDVLIFYGNDQIQFANPGSSFLDANYRYESAFATAGFLARTTSDPGFESWPDFLNPGDQIGFTASESRFGTFLTAFDTFTGSILTEHEYSIRVTPPGGVDFLEVTADEGGSRLLGTASSNGYFHFHSLFRLSDNAPIGAYGFLMTLDTSAPGIADSEKFWLIFNFGMPEADFSHAVTQFTGIPEPTSVGIFFVGSSIFWIRRRRIVTTAI